MAGADIHHKNHAPLRIRLSTFIWLIVFFACSALYAVKPLCAESASHVTWYSGGESSLKLSSISNSAPGELSVSGSTSLKKLLISVSKNGRNARSNPLPIAADGSFSVRYLVKDGSGSYTISFYGADSANSLKLQGLATTSQDVRSALPVSLQSKAINQAILMSVQQVMGKKVGRGECWDLAQMVLDTNLADWDRPSRFGSAINPESSDIQAGDIIQFKSLVTSEKLPGGVTRTHTLGAPDHTAIIYRVLGSRRYTIAQQNANGKRYVSTEDIDLTHIINGSYRIYRPVALMLHN